MNSPKDSFSGVPDRHKCSNFCSDICDAGWEEAAKWCTWIFIPDSEDPVPASS